MFFLEDCETFFNLDGDIYPETARLIQDTQIPPYSGIRRSISYLFWSTIPAKLCWHLRATLRNRILKNLILGVFIRNKESEVTSHT